jgi:hypothetical protein
MASINSTSLNLIINKVDDSHSFHEQNQPFPNNLVFQTSTNVIVDEKFGEGAKNAFLLSGFGLKRTMENLIIDFEIHPDFPGVIRRSRFFTSKGLTIHTTKNNLDTINKEKEENDKFSRGMIATFSNINEYKIDINSIYRKVCS